MKPHFVSNHDGVRTMHWGKLLGFSIGLGAVAAVVALGLAYLVTGTFSVAYLVVAETLVILSLARIVIHALSHEPSDVETSASN